MLTLIAASAFAMASGLDISWAWPIIPLAFCLTLYSALTRHQVSDEQEGCYIEPFCKLVAAAIVFVGVSFATTDNSLVDYFRVQGAYLLAICALAGAILSLKVIRE